MKLFQKLTKLFLPRLVCINLDTIKLADIIFNEMNYLLLTG